MGVPKEIWRLVDALVSRPGGLATPGLFTQAGAPGELLAIRAAVDQNHVQLDAPLNDAREVAFFPPVTGG